MTSRINPLAAIFALLIALAMLIYARAAFLTDAQWVIADDARQFLAWTSRIADPQAMPGNFMADYWQQTAPPFYRALLYAAVAVGMPPILLSKLLPLLLLPLSAVLAWKLSGVFARERAAQFGGALCIIATALHTDSIFSGTPRAFALPLMLFAIHGMAAGRNGLAVLGLLMLGVVYPAPAITCLGLFTLHLLQWKPPLRLGLTGGRVGLIALAAACVVLPALLFKSGLDIWGPTLTMSEARGVFSMMLYDGRSSITGPHGDIAWLCSRRIGFLPSVVNCRGNADPRLLINLCLTIVPMLLLWFWQTRGRGQAETAAGKDAARWQLFPYSLVSAIICYLIAAAIAFKVHLPARYSQPVLLIMGSLAFGILAGQGWERLKKSGRGVFVGIAALCLLLALAAYATPKTTLARPRDGALIGFIGGLSPAIRIAGIESDLDFVPAATGRGVLATTEHDIPYHRQYHRKNSDGLRASLQMGELTSPAAVAAIQRYRIDLLVFDRKFLETGVVPGRYLRTMAPPHQITPSKGQLAKLRAASCRIVETRYSVLIFTGCYARLAEAASSGAK